VRVDADHFNNIGSLQKDSAQEVVPAYRSERSFEVFCIIGIFENFVGYRICFLGLKTFYRSFNTWNNAEKHKKHASKVKHLVTLNHQKS
jgi:hypothetical protein